MEKLTLIHIIPQPTVVAYNENIQLLIQRDTIMRNRKKYREIFYTLITRWHSNSQFCLQRQNTVSVDTQSIIS